MSYATPVPVGLDRLAFRLGERAREMLHGRGDNPYGKPGKQRAWLAGWEQRDTEIAAWVTAGAAGTVNA